MHHADVRDLTPTEQSVTLAKAAENLANEAEKLSGADTEKLKAELAQAQESIKKLEAGLAQADADKKSMQAKLDEAAAQQPRATEISETPKPLSEVKDTVPETALAVPKPFEPEVAPSATPYIQSNAKNLGEKRGSSNRRHEFMALSRERQLESLMSGKETEELHSVPP